MADRARRIAIDDPGYWKTVHDSNYEPHWAIKVLLVPKGEELDELVRDGEYMVLGTFPDEPVTPERALGLFDKDSLGWVPLWFPREAVYDRWKMTERRVSLSPQERLDWFDKALAYYAQTEWPPAGSLESKQRAVALSLLQMLYIVELEYGLIPTPDEM